MERMGMTGMAAGMSPMAGATGAMTPNMMMLPRCKYKIEKGSGGLTITCTCDDQTARGMLQNLCSMMQGCMVSCCLMMNGMTVCCCNLTMGLCMTEMTGKGCKITCTSGDTKCAQMIQSCGDCMNTMLQAGCTCCLMMNNNPVCCGTA
jgi:hypothetical protein